MLAFRLYRLMKGPAQVIKSSLVRELVGLDMDQVRKCSAVQTESATSSGKSKATTNFPATEPISPIRNGGETALQCPPPSYQNKGL